MSEAGKEIIPNEPLQRPKCPVTWQSIIAATLKNHPEGLNQAEYVQEIQAQPDFLAARLPLPDGNYADVMERLVADGVIRCRPRLFSKVNYMLIERAADHEASLVQNPHEHRG